MVTRLNVMPHQGKDLTGREMYRLAEAYSGDLGGLAALPLEMWYDRVRSIPYASDDEIFPESIVEVVARPDHLLNRRLFPSLDCKKKSILMGAWAAANRRPFRFIAVSEVPSRDIHHVITEIDNGQGFIAVDATMPHYRLGQGLPITYGEVLQR